jgi:hypothetical protein
MLASYLHDRRFQCGRWCSLREVTLRLELAGPRQAESAYYLRMKRDKRKQQVRRGTPELPHPKCVYCGIRDGTQREHVLASSFFGKPFPPDLPKVPACRDCNQLRGDGGQRNMSDDEAYVRDRICMQLEIDNHPDAKRLLESKVSRNLLRPESKRLREVIVASMEPGSVELEPGLYLSGVWSFKIDLTIFERVMQKIVRGLYAYHMQRMPDDYGVVVLPRLDQDMFDRSRAWIEANNPSPVHELGTHKTVCYRFASQTPSPVGNNWLVTFYNRYAFYAHTGPKKDIPDPPVAKGQIVPGRSFPVNNFFRFD